MIAITTSSSISVNPLGTREQFLIGLWAGAEPTSADAGSAVKH
jgi:hypothetical protein